MWLKLDDSLRQISDDHQQEIYGLELALLSIFQGEHALALSSGLGDELLKLPLSRHSVAAIKNSTRKSAEQISAWRQSPFKISITFNDKLVKKISPSEWILPISLIAQNGMPKSLVLAEDLTDARLYKHSAEHHRILNNTAHKFSTQLLSGGGGSTPKILQHELQQRHFFIFCITDSDRNYPAAGANSTSKKCKENIVRSDWIGHHYALREREAENVLPKNLIEDTLSRPEHKETFEKYCILQNHKYTDAEWEYLDLKQGTLLSKCCGAIDFWSRAAKDACKRGVINEICLQDGSCCRAAGEECGCLIAPGMGEKFLEHTADYLDHQTSHSSALRVKTAGNSKSWLQIGASIFSWAAATEKIRA